MLYCDHQNFPAGILRKIFRHERRDLRLLSRRQGTDVYPSHGLDVEPAYTDKIRVLRDKLMLHHDNPKWRVNLPGSGSCDQTATENIQGRLLNGVAAERVCSTAASSYTQKFIHIEQHKEFRDPNDWIAPITDTFP